MPELDQLRYFIEVADLRSFSRAAEMLHISQPAISQQISALEREFGCRLFVRQRHGVELTAAGFVLKDHTQRILAALGEAESAMMQIGPAAQGTRLRLGSSVGPLRHLLPALMESFSRRHPGLIFSVTLGSTVAVCAKVFRGSLDAGIANMPIPEGLAVRRLYEDHPKLIVHRGHPLTAYARVPVGALRGHPFACLPRGHPTTDKLLSACKDLGFFPAVVLETDNGELIREFVSRGLAIAVVPSLLVRTADDARLAILDMEGDMARTLAVVTREPASPQSLIGEFIEDLCRNVGASAEPSARRRPLPLAGRPRRMSAR